MSGRRIAALVAAGRLSPVEVTEHFLGRAEEVAGRLRCFQELDAPGAREQARIAERAVLAGDTLGPLHGVPVGVKANVPVAGLGLYALFGETKAPVRVTRRRGSSPPTARCRRRGDGNDGRPGHGSGKPARRGGQRHARPFVPSSQPLGFDQSSRFLELGKRRGRRRRGPSHRDRDGWRRVHAPAGCVVRCRGSAPDPWPSARSRACCVGVEHDGGSDHTRRRRRRRGAPSDRRTGWSDNRVTPR